MEAIAYRSLISSLLIYLVRVNFVDHLALVIILQVAAEQHCNRNLPIFIPMKH